MTWATIAVAAGSAIVGGVSASQANKRAKAASGSLDDAIAYARMNPGVFGEKIDFESISYSPLSAQDPGYGNIAGDVIAGTSGARKIRVALEGRGKRGGGRVIYYYRHARNAVFFLALYPKN